MFYIFVSYVTRENQITNAFDASVVVINPEYLETQKCKILCTIFKIDGDMGWFYVGCKKCRKKVEMNKNNDTTIVVKLKKPTFWCPKCNLNIT
ncbi:putative nucleic acid-binding protein [Arabidopsis thaliana]